MLNILFFTHPSTRGAVQDTCTDCIYNQFAFFSFVYRYGAIKSECFVRYGVNNQVVLAKTLQRKGADSIIQSIAIQINAKLGGQPWASKELFVSRLSQLLLFPCIDVLPSQSLPSSDTFWSTSYALWYVQLHKDFNHTT